jgi:hypothetical protein
VSLPNHLVTIPAEVPWGADAEDRMPSFRVRHTVAAAALALSGTQAGALSLYDNFDPTVTTGPGADFSATQYADISGYCASFNCPWINVYSAGFTFTAEASGIATRAYLPLDALSTYQGAERFYRISIYNTAGQLVVQGGLLGRHVPLAAAPTVYEFELNRDYEAGQTLSASAELVAGQTYQAYFHQRFGSMSQTHWMKTDEVPAPDQAYAHCATNVGGLCAYWDNGWVYPHGTAGYTAPMTDFLPALALTDGNGITSPVPEPGTWALTALGVGALLMRRRAKATDA